MSACEIEYLEADTEYIKLDQSEIIEAEAPDENEENWDSKSTAILLKLYLENLDKFRNPKIRKKNVWLEIASALGKTPDSCDKKFRNLKQTYIRLLKKKADGLTKIKWAFFDIFNEIYCVDGEYQPEIQQKIQDCSNEAIVAQALRTLKHAPSYTGNGSENGKVESEEDKKRVNKRRYAELRKVTFEMRDRQRMVEEKLDRLINIVEESNNIQRERNGLFEQFLEKINQT